MRLLFGLFFAIGLLLAGGAVMFVKEHIEQYQIALANERAANASRVETVKIYVADRALGYGDELRPEDVRLVDWPVTSLPDGIFTAEQPVMDPGDPRPRHVLRAIERFEPILPVKVSAPGEGAGLGARLERGMRAFAIEVDVASGVSGFLRPGDRVDIYWTGQIAADTEINRGELTRLIQQSVQLVAVDQTATGDMEGAMVARTVTVSVRPEQVAALATAQATGRLSLSLVGSGDDTIVGQVQVDQRSLLGLQREVAQVAESVPETCYIRTRRAGEMVETPVPCNN